ncbi:MAG: hypothetical protein AAFQ65_06130 [Myxococcota bacterium]
MKLKTLIVGMVSLLLPTAAVAWDGSVTGKVAMVSVNTDGQVYVRLEGSPDLCTSTGSSSPTSRHSAVMKAGRSGDGITHTSEGVQLMLKLLLSAKLSGKAVEVNSSNSSGWGCTLGNVRLTE